jgi:Family of unknown function (DUF6335)
MAGTNPSDAVNPSSTQPSAEIEELLLADLVGTENADPIFEEVSDRDAEIGTILKRLKNPMSEDVTGGDLDDDWYQAEVVGEEAVGGDNPTPDQSVTENLLHSMGITSIDGHPVQTWTNLQQRDLKRWELDPESSEDYREHGE